MMGGFMQRRTHLSLGKLTALATLTVVGGVAVLTGQQMFSPGPLSIARRAGGPLGGVASHGDLSSNCAACHAPPWSRETMASRCQTCHTDIATQINDGLSLHGRIANAGECRTCHTEHRGTHAELTRFDEFDHDWTNFPLTGQHRGVDCGSCHTNKVYKGTSHDCASCHAEPQVHRGQFGLRCASCHSTESWTGAVFAHRFPLNHGGGGKKNKACSMCHTTANDYSTYTCYECHRHDPTKTAEKHLKKGIAEIRNCTECHPTGRKASRRQATADDLRWTFLLACRSQCHAWDADEGEGQ